jgi:hypothetical protein
MKTRLIFLLLILSQSANAQPVLDLLNRIHNMVLWKEKAIQFDLKANSIDYSVFSFKETENTLFVSSYIGIDIQFVFNRFDGNPKGIVVYFEDSPNGQSLRNKYYKFAESSFSRSSDGMFWFYYIDKKLITVTFNDISVGLIPS